MGQFLFRNGQWVSIKRIIEQNKKIDNKIEIIMVDRPVIKKAGRPKKK
jgi:hypothetical protein